MTNVHSMLLEIGRLLEISSKERNIHIGNPCQQRKQKASPCWMEMFGLGLGVVAHFPNLNIQGVRPVWLPFHIHAARLAMVCLHAPTKCPPGPPQ